MTHNACGKSKKCVCCKSYCARSVGFHHRKLKAGKKNLIQFNPAKKSKEKEKKRAAVQTWKQSERRVCQFCKSLTGRWLESLNISRGSGCRSLLLAAAVQAVVGQQRGAWSDPRPVPCCRSHRCCTSCPTRGRTQCSEPGSRCIWSVNKHKVKLTYWGKSLTFHSKIKEKITCGALAVNKQHCMSLAL